MCAVREENVVGVVPLEPTLVHSLAREIAIAQGHFRAMRWPQRRYARLPFRVKGYN